MSLINARAIFLVNYKMPKVINDVLSSHLAGLSQKFPGCWTDEREARKNKVTKAGR